MCIYIYIYKFMIIVMMIVVMTVIIMDGQTYPKRFLPEPVALSKTQ